MIKLKDVNSLVYQMESLGSKTANCITPEEQSPFIEMPLSLFHIYTINGFDQCYKKNTSKNPIYIHINQLQEGLYYWSFRFLIPGSLHQIYHASILIPWSSPHTSSNLQFILFECTYSWLLVWLAIKAWRLPMHCPIVQSERAL